MRTSSSWFLDPRKTSASVRTADTGALAFTRMGLRRRQCCGSKSARASVASASRLGRSFVILPQTFDQGPEMRVQERRRQQQRAQRNEGRDAINAAQLPYVEDVQLHHDETDESEAGNTVDRGSGGDADRHQDHRVY